MVWPGVLWIGTLWRQPGWRPEQHSSLMLSGSGRDHRRPLLSTGSLWGLSVCLSDRLSVSYHRNKLKRHLSILVAVRKTKLSVLQSQLIFFFFFLNHLEEEKCTASVLSSHLCCLGLKRSVRGSFLSHCLFYSSSLPRFVIPNSTSHCLCLVVVT